MNQELVKFGSDKLITITKDGKQYVSVRSVSVALGLDAKWQVREIKNNNVLKHEVCTDTLHYAGKMRNLTFLNIAFLQGWLFKINSNTVNPASKSKLEAYQRKCYEVLYDYFYGSHERLRVAQTEKFMKLQRIKELEDLINGLPNYQEYSQERKRLKKDVANLEMDTFQQLKLM